MPASDTAIALDLNRRAFTKPFGPLLVIGSWVRIERDWKPCLVLIRATDELSGNVVPCVVTLNEVVHWHVMDERAARTCARFAHVLRLPPSKATLFNITSLIQDMTGDLYHIPVVPPGLDEARPLAELTITHRDSGKTKEVLLRDV